MSSKQRIQATPILSQLLLLSALLLAGCGGDPDYETIPIFPVKGQLFVNGVPAEGAIVQLFPDEKQEGTEHELTPAGEVDTEGNFELTTYENSDGAPPGNYKVTITWPDPDWRPKQGPPGIPPDRLKGAFSDPRDSDRTVTVKEGETILEPIRLENVQILEGSSLPRPVREK